MSDEPTLTPEEEIAKLKRRVRTLEYQAERMKRAMTLMMETLRVPAADRKFMQIAGPARRCINLIKPFINIDA